MSNAQTHANYREQLRALALRLEVLRAGAQRQVLLERAHGLIAAARTPRHSKSSEPAPRAR